jgi:hypothetical protein
MSILKIKRKNLSQVSPENASFKPDPVKVPELKQNKTSGQLPGLVALVGFIISILGFSLYIKESKSKGNIKQGQFKVTISVVDSNNLPVEKAVFKSGNRILGESSSDGKWRKNFQISGGAEYPLLIEAQDSQGNLEAKLVKITFPTWSKQSANLNRTIQMVKLRNTQDSPEILPSSAAASGNVEIGTEVEKSQSRASSFSANREVKIEEGKLYTKSSREFPTSEANVSLRSQAKDQISTNESLDLNSPGEGNKNSANGASPESSPREPSVNLDLGSYPKSIWVSAIGDSGLKNEKDSQSLVAIKDAMLFRAKALGLVSTEKSPFKIFLKHLEAKVGENSQNLVEVTVNFQGKTMGTFLRNYQENTIATARLILWRSHLEIPVRYSLKRVGDKFQIAQFENQSKLWQLSEGNVIQDKNGMAASVSSLSNHDHYLSLSAPAGFCGTSPTCNVQLVNEEGAPKDWVPRSLRILGLGNREVSVFAGGNPSPKVHGEFLYRGLPNGFTIFTVLEGGQIIYRNAQHNNLYQQTIISLPLPSISSR